MNEFPYDPAYLTIGLPAALIGLLLGIGVALLISRSRAKRMAEERESAFELANAKLSQTFAELSNRSLNKGWKRSRKKPRVS